MIPPLLAKIIHTWWTEFKFKDIFEKQSMSLNPHYQMFQKNTSNSVRLSKKSHFQFHTPTSSKLSPVLNSVQLPRIFYQIPGVVQNAI